MKLFSPIDIPYPNGPILAARKNMATVRGELDSVTTLRVPLEAHDFSRLFGGSASIGLPCRHFLEGQLWRRYECRNHFSATVFYRDFFADNHEVINFGHDFVSSWFDGDF